MYTKTTLRNKDKEGLSTVYIQYVHAGSDVKRFTTGVKVLEKYFDADAGKIKKNGTLNVDEDNRIIHTIRANVETIIKNHFAVKGVKPTVKYVTQEYEKLNDTTKQPEKTFLDYVDEFITLRKTQETNPNTLKGYQNLRDNIAEYETLNKIRLNIEDVNTAAFFEAYKDFLVKTKKYLNSTIFKRLGVFKTILNHYTKLDINKSQNFKLFKFDNKKVKNAKVITLNRKEIELLTTLDLTQNKRLERVRDYFILECWTGLRFSDLMNLSKAEIDGKFLNVITVKTIDNLKIPLFPEAKRILEKYNYEIKPISLDKYNEYLKEVCALVPALNEEEITKIHYNGNKAKPITKTKADWIASHTARRSFASMMLLEFKQPQSRVMRYTGHTTTRSFEVYLNSQQGEDEDLELVMEML